jgi:energy-coupling factor transporter ATP-binding protein EcfA2
MSERTKLVAWVDRVEEAKRLAEAIADGKSLLIWGPAGAGKTALVEHVLAGLPKGEASRHLYVSGWKSRQELLRALVRRMHEANDSVLSGRLASEGADGSRFDRWLGEQTSLRLRGLVYRATRSSRYRIFLDHPPAITQSMKRVLGELIWGSKTPVYLLAQSVGRGELGPVWSLYWNDQGRLALEPLADPAAAELLENCIAGFGLAAYASEDFRQEVLRLSNRLPRAIVGMCWLASQPGYHCEGQIKTRLVHVDYLIGQERGPRGALGKGCRQ